MSADKVVAKIAKMPGPFAEMGQRLHSVIMQAAPNLEPVWRWGLPFYRKNGEDFCYFRPEAEKFMFFGFGGCANLSREPGAPDQLVASAWYFKTLDAATEARISAMVQAAVR